MIFNREDYMSSQDVKDFIDYFEGNVVVNSKNKDKYSKEIDLEKAIEIYESKLLDIRKIYELTKIYKNSETINKAFSK